MEAARGEHEGSKAGNKGAAGGRTGDSTRSGCTPSGDELVLVRVLAREEQLSLTHAAAQGD
jgi:hypothetical protein